MARIRRLVVPGYPHHVTQRGNRKQPTFFSQDDYQMYLMFMSEAKATAKVEIWSYCLMPNHVHFIVVPEEEDGLANLFKEAHRRYTRKINSRYEWQGHLWQERFHSFAMDESHLMSAARYIELNPVRAGLCEQASDWPWSSAMAHLRGENDLLVDVAPMLERSPDWKHYLGADSGDETIESIRRHSSTGRPAGNENFQLKLESLTGRDLRLRQAGRKKRSNAE